MPFNAPEYCTEKFSENVEIKKKSFFLNFECVLKKNFFLKISQFRFIDFFKISRFFEIQNAKLDRNYRTHLTTSLSCSTNMKEISLARIIQTDKINQKLHINRPKKKKSKLNFNFEF